MIYLFTGTDAAKARAKAFEWVAKAREKEPNLAYARLAREELTGSALEDAESSGGLFARRLLVLIDDPYPVTRAASADDLSDVARPSSDVGRATSCNIDDHLEALAASENAILILAPALTAAKQKKLESIAKRTYAFDAPVLRQAKGGFNAGLVNALAARARERLWLELMRAFAAGDAPEMLHGLLHWKARDLMEKGSTTWSPKESRQLSLDLIALLQDSRRSGLPLPVALERFALTL
jgi:hypothetical protein